MIRLRRMIERGFTFIGVGGIIFLLVRIAPRRTLLPLTLLAGALLIVVFNDSLFIGGYRPLDGGDDGLANEGFGRLIARNLLASDWPEAFRGEQSVFVFTPGLRYFRALELFVFGDIFLGYLSASWHCHSLCLHCFADFLP